MSVKQEANGRRSVEVEFDVAGTPEQVWDAIATGPGMSSWFVPTRFEERDGKAVSMHMAFGSAEPSAAITAWDPPRMWAGEGQPYAGAPPIATEWHIEARAGGTCRMRIVHSLFASTDAWDEHLEGAAGGWSGFLANLRLYLTHFRGQRGTLMQIATPVAGTEAEGWDALITALGVKGVRIGDTWTTPAGVEPLGGVLDSITENPYDALLRLQSPRPGIAALGAYTYPGSAHSMVGMNLYLYGDESAATVARVTPIWEAWFREQFPAPAESAATTS